MIDQIVVTEMIDWIEVTEMIDWIEMTGMIDQIRVTDQVVEKTLNPQTRSLTEKQDQKRTSKEGIAVEESQILEMTVSIENQLREYQNQEKIEIENPAIDQWKSRSAER